VNTLPDSSGSTREVQSTTRSVWKYDVPLAGVVMSFTMPVGAAVVHVGTQREGFVTFWAEVRPSNPTVLRGFRIVGTGHQVADGDEYVGTTIAAPFVWHLHEVAR
jgi:hypothetical protein